MERGKEGDSVLLSGSMSLSPRLGNLMVLPLARV